MPTPTMGASASGEERPPGLASRVTGILLSPSATFRRVLRRPVWLDVLLLVALVSAGALAVLLATPTGRQALLDRQVDRLEWYGVFVDDEAYDRMRQNVAVSGAAAVAATLLGAPVAALGLSLAIWLVLGRGRTSGLSPGEAFRGTLAVVAHSGIVLALQRLIVAPVNYLQESFGSPFNAARFFPMVDEAGFVGRVLGGVDLFVAWWLVVLGIGVGIVYGRPAGGVTLRLLAAYAGLAAILAAAGMLLTPDFG